MHTEKIRVLHVIARFNIGGTASYLKVLLPGLGKHFETLLVVGNVQAFEVEDSRLEYINFERIQTLGRQIHIVNDFRAYLELRKIVKRFSPHIIHSHTFKAGLISRLMFFRIQKIHTFHGHLLTDPEFSHLEKKLIVVSERILAKFTNTIISVGNQVARELIEKRIGKSEQYISIISELEPLNFISQKEARKKLEISPDQTVVLWMARMAPVKNPFLVLSVARLLPTTLFLMAGEGELFYKIRSEIPQNVRLLGWVQPEKILPAADVFLVTSFNEGMPYTVLEAIMAKVPVVAVNSGAIAEMIESRVNGILTSQNPYEIAEKISELLGKSIHDYSRQTNMDCSDKSTFSKKDRLVSSHIALYNKIVLNNHN